VDMQVSAPSKILVFHIGHVGDTVMILPSLRALQFNFPDASFTFLSDRVLGSKYVLGASLFGESGFFQRTMNFPKVRKKNPWLGFLNGFFLVAMLPVLRRNKFDAVVYLMPSRRRSGQIRRDKRYFRAAGVRRFFGFEGFDAEGQRKANPNSYWLHETEAILNRLRIDGLCVPDEGQADMGLSLTGSEKRAVDDWLSRQGRMHVSRPMIGFGPGSKMQAKRWPKERFIEVGRRLICSHDMWPVVFGGDEEKADGDELLRAWGRGYNAAGALGLRHAAEALSRCALYLGNDTGTMHLAACVGTPCIACFSARDLKGKWYPYGTKHTVLRKDMTCAGCMLEFCEQKSCLMQISVDEVVEAAVSKLRALRW